MKSNPCRELSAPAADPTGRISLSKKNETISARAPSSLHTFQFWLSFVFLILIYGECD